MKLLSMKNYLLFWTVKRKNTNKAKENKPNDSAQTWYNQRDYPNKTPYEVYCSIGNSRPPIISYTSDNNNCKNNNWLQN